MEQTGNESSWPRVLAGALVATVAILVVIMLVSGGVIPPLIVICAIFIPLAWAVLRWPQKRWVLILATALAALAVIGNAPYLLEDLAHPDSAWVFAPSALSLVAGIVAVIGGIAAILRRSDGPARAVVGGAAVLGVVLVLFAVVATLGVDSDAQAQGDVVVVAKGIKYPETVTTKAGKVAFFVQNEDRVRHTFVIDDAGVEQELPASANRRIEVTLKAGSYEFHCSVMGHEDMKGTLTVAP